MCGIFGYVGINNKASKIVLEGIKTLEYRGYDSWGIATLYSKLNKNKIIIKKKAGMIGDANVDDLPKSHMVLGHTRWATHGGVTDINAHPHLDCTSQFAIIHNGIIENYDEIKGELIRKEHKFISETDTEVAVHLVEENYKKTKNFLEAVRLAFNRFMGLSAIIVMDAKSQTFVAAKNGSPLAIGKGLKENLLASDAHAILPYTKNVYFMEDEDLVEVSKNNISVYSVVDGTKKTISFTKLSWSINRTDKGNFPHYMLKEIYDQPKVIENIIASRHDDIRKMSFLIGESYGTYLIGCGTAAYACLAGTYIFSKIAKRHVNFAVASEFGYSLEFLTDKSLVVALSQSGETIDVIEAVKKAKEKGSQIASMVNVLGSTLYRLSDFKLLLNAGVEKAVVTTKAFTAKLTYLILLAHLLAGTIDEGRSELKSVIIAIKKLLHKDNLGLIKKLAQKMSVHNHIYVVGRGLSYPISLETALKIKEASYIHAEGFAAGELKHGVIALIEKGTPCIVFLPNDETYSATLAGAMEMKARGGYIIGVSFKNMEVFDCFLPVNDSGTSTVITMAVLGQLIGYYLARKRHLNPDKPRNLAKSVTVK